MDKGLTDAAADAPPGAVLAEACGVDVRIGAKAILSGADLRVRAGEIVTLIGPNGAGKTTFLRVILGLQRPRRGRVFRRPGLRVGYVPQRLALDATLPLTVERFLALGAGRGGREGAARRAAILDAVGAAQVLASPVRDISGGELQRVLLARALLRDPDLLVLDEPVQGVDVSGQADLYGLIGRIRDERGCGVLLVSHDLHLVMAAADQVICLNHHVCCAGRPEAVTRDPAYLALFGEHVARQFAVYHHDHDHRHGTDGAVLPLAPEPDDGRPRAETPDHG